MRLETNCSTETLAHTTTRKSTWRQRPNVILMTYFSDREAGSLPPIQTEVTIPVWKGVTSLVRVRLASGSFGARYPEVCEDGNLPVGTDYSAFWDAMYSEIPTLDNLSLEVTDCFTVPPTSVVMDIIEFCWRAVGRVTPIGYHSFLKHEHLDFDVEEGRSQFVEEVKDVKERIDHETPGQQSLFD